MSFNGSHIPSHGPSMFPASTSPRNPFAAALCVAAVNEVRHSASAPYMARESSLDAAMARTHSQPQPLPHTAQPQPMHSPLTPHRLPVTYEAYLSETLQLPARLCPGLVAPSALVRAVLRGGVRTVWLQWTDLRGRVLGKQMVSKTNQ